MPVVRAADIVSITTDDLELDEPTFKTTQKQAKCIIDLIRRLAESIACYTEDMESVKDTDILRLQILSQPHPAQELNLGFHKVMENTLYKWAKGKGFGINPDIYNGNIFWLRGQGMRISEGKVVILIFVRRPRPREGEGAQGTAPVIAVREEPPFKGIILSPTAGGGTTKSCFECQVGEMIFLQSGEQVLLRKDVEKDRDICFYCIAHLTT
ncbi:hypothetical protein B0H66DRAFT_570691 [Apodospora peruviana]|uniref:Uncharacterized protein n=1 Tax=Apodospora peruviana TaxID=516989 RepID=A0AAE0HUZ9_9PEZI|nr:hypothetical protein B0H66DRAFT_570691 [Apodospora peruviana]